MNIALAAPLDAPVRQAIGGLGPVELIIILVIVLLIFGAGKLPQIGDALGKSINAFKASSQGQDASTVDVTPEREEAPPKSLEAQAAAVAPEADEEKRVDQVEETAG